MNQQREVTVDCQTGEVAWKLSICKGSVVEDFPVAVEEFWKSAAIVNAANETCIGGKGVDGEVNLQGGRVLIRARRNLPAKGRPGVRCRSGEAVWTPAGKLKVECVIHAVGPIFLTFSESEMTKLEDQLKSVYRNSLFVANTEDELRIGKTHYAKSPCSHVGFALISAGAFRGQKKLNEVLKLGFEGILSFFESPQFQTTPPVVKHVRLYGWTVEEWQELNKVLEEFIQLENNKTEFTKI